MNVFDEIISEVQRFDTHFENGNVTDGQIVTNRQVILASIADT